MYCGGSPPILTHNQTEGKRKILGAIEETIYSESVLRVSASEHCTGCLAHLALLALRNHRPQTQKCKRPVVRTARQWLKRGHSVGDSQGHTPSDCHSGP